MSTFIDTLFDVVVVSSMINLIASSLCYLAYPRVQEKKRITYSDGVVKFTLVNYNQEELRIMLDHCLDINYVDENNVDDNKDDEERKDGN